jgi:hypothetical protein
MKEPLNGSTVNVGDSSGQVKTALADRRQQFDLDS